MKEMYVEPIQQIKEPYMSR